MAHRRTIEVLSFFSLKSCPAQRPSWILPLDLSLLGLEELLCALPQAQENSVCASSSSRQEPGLAQDSEATAGQSPSLYRPRNTSCEQRGLEDQEREA